MTPRTERQVDCMNTIEHREAVAKARADALDEAAALIERHIAQYAGTQIPGPTYWINEKLREVAAAVRKLPTGGS